MGFFKGLRDTMREAKEIEKTFDPVAQMKAGTANLQAANASMQGNLDIFRLRNEGVKARAKLIDLVDTGMATAGTPVLEFRLLVTPPDGVAYEAVVRRSLQPGENGLFSRGMDLQVYVDPADPQRIGF